MKIFISEDRNPDTPGVGSVGGYQYTNRKEPLIFNLINFTDKEDTDDLKVGTVDYMFGMNSLKSTTKIFVKDTTHTSSEIKSMIEMFLKRKYGAEIKGSRIVNKNVTEILGVGGVDQIYEKYMKIVESFQDGDRVIVKDGSFKKHG